MRRSARADVTSFLALVLTIVACGAVMMRSGSAAIAKALWQENKGRNQGVVPYDTTLAGLRALVGTSPPSALWYIIIGDAESFRRACTEVRQAWTAAQARESALVLALGGSVPVEGWDHGCRGAYAPAGLRPRAARRLIADLAGGGFIVTDRDLRAVYSSRKITDLRELPAVLALFATAEPPVRPVAPSTHLDASALTPVP